MDKIKKKKIFIILIYSLIIILILFGLFLYFKPEANCNDGKKNQDEEGIDCGGFCQKECEKIAPQNLVIEKNGVIPAGISGEYDFYAFITNPNAVLGNSKFEYIIKFKDEAGNVLVERSGQSFILPSEKKYIIENNIAVTDYKKVEFRITSSEWVEFFDYEKPDVQVINKNYNNMGNTGSAEATGLIKNESVYDFDTINIQVILKDNKGKPVALNSTQMKTVKAGERREFKVIWPYNVSQSVNNMEVQTEINVFNSDTFLKRSYKSEKFQQY